MRRGRKRGDARGRRLDRGMMMKKMTTTMRRDVGRWNAMRRVMRCDALMTDDGATRAVRW